MKKILAIMLTLVLVFSCSAAFAELTFTTGGSSGTYYAFGGVLGQFVTDNSDVAISAVTGEGSAANIDMLDMEFAQLGLVQSDVAYYAYNGIKFEQYEGAPITSFTALAALYNETVQLVTCNPEIKSMALDRGGVDSMVFDEIDTGVSGRMAQVVGEKMRAIAKKKQVLCVTHLPQIAALGDAHFLVEKRTDGERTQTDVIRLDDDGRVRELSRLVGGAEDSRSSLDHAGHMLEAARIRRAGK